MTRPTKWERVHRALARRLDAPPQRHFWVALEAALLECSVTDASQELEALARAAILAAHYGEAERADRWIAEHKAMRQTRGTLTALEIETCACIQMGVDLVAKRRAAAADAYLAIQWDKALPAAWVRNLRLRMAVNRHCREEIIDALRRPPASLGAMTPSDRGACLLVLADYHLERQDFARARILYLKARRAAAADPLSLHSRLVSAFATANLGLTALTENRLHEARDVLAQATTELRNLGLRAMLFNYLTKRAFACVLLEEHDKAKEILCEVHDGWRGARRRRSALAPGAFEGHFVLACSAVATRETARASRHVRHAERALRHCSTPRFRAQYHLMKAMTLGHAGKPALLQKAFHELNASERIYGSLGDGLELGLGWVHRLRGELLLLQRRTADALCAATRSLSSLGKRREWLLENDVLLLKSRILIQRDTPCPEDLYEDVLSNLGVARNPVTLFKVVANLYLYSWELKHDVDLTAHHLNQVNRMAEHLDPATFQRLYHEHVWTPVMRIAIKKVFGISASRAG